jgi:LuxR family transcriptional regulator, maltose regulon positive regulatory protein
VCFEALALMERLGHHSTTEGYCYYFLASAYLAWNRLEEATVAVEHMLRVAQDWQQADLLITGNHLLVWICLARGNVARAWEVLQQAEALTERERLATHMSLLAQSRARYWLATSDLAAARRWAEGVDVAPETWDFNRSAEFFLLVRVYLAQGQYETALAMLQRFRPHFDRPNDFYATVSFLALEVAAQHGMGQDTRARITAVRLLTLTEARGTIRVYLEAGEPMRRVLQQLHDPRQDDDHSLSSRSRAYAAKVLSAFSDRAHHSADDVQTTSDIHRQAWPRSRSH